MLNLLSTISNLIQKGIDKQQAIRLVVGTMPDKERAMATAYFHKNLSGD